MNFKCIVGRTRIVILLWGLAFKIPNFLKWKMFLLGLQGSMLEADNAKRSSIYLAPMVFVIPGGWLNVMARADRVFADGEEKDPLLIDYFKELLDNRSNSSLQTILDLDCMEVSVPENYGLCKGRVVCIDYGASRNQDLNSFLIEELIKKVQR